VVFTVEGMYQSIYPKIQTDGEPLDVVSVYFNTPHLNLASQALDV
jgi:hypothetical protein